VLTLTILMILTAAFVFLAVKNWKTTIGAGPTILIIGAIVVSAYVPLKWNEYQQMIREYDVCAARVERSIDTNRFNATLIAIIIREYPNREDIAEELRDVSLPPLSLEIDCPPEPQFIKVFFTDFGAATPRGTGK